MYPAGILFNFKTKRYHTIVFRQSPLPGGVDGGRYKSVGHHTEGFDTLQDAEADLASEANRQKGIRDYGHSWFWDGESAPARVEFFGQAPVWSNPARPCPRNGCRQRTHRHPRCSTRPDDLDLSV